MNEFVIEVVNVKFSAACTDVAIFIEVRLKTIINTRDKSKNAKIKFPSVYQKRTVDVFLDYKGLSQLHLLLLITFLMLVVFEERVQFTLTYVFRIANYLSDFGKFLANLYSAAAV